MKRVKSRLVNPGAVVETDHGRYPVAEVLPALDPEGAPVRIFVLDHPEHAGPCLMHAADEAHVRVVAR